MMQQLMKDLYRISLNENVSMAFIASSNVAESPNTWNLYGRLVNFDEIDESLDDASLDHLADSGLASVTHVG